MDFTTMLKGDGLGDGSAEELHGYAICKLYVHVYL